MLHRAAKYQDYHSCFSCEMLVGWTNIQPIWHVGVQEILVRGLLTSSEGYVRLTLPMAGFVVTGELGPLLPEHCNPQAAEELRVKAIRISGE